MDETILKKIDEQRETIDKIYLSVEKTRKYFLWTMIISAIVIVLPIIGLLIAIPNFLSLYDSVGLGL